MMITSLLSYPVCILGIETMAWKKQKNSNQHELKRKTKKKLLLRSECFFLCLFSHVNSLKFNSATFVIAANEKCGKIMPELCFSRVSIYFAETVNKMFISRQISFKNKKALLRLKKPNQLFPIDRTPIRSSMRPRIHTPPSLELVKETFPLSFLGFLESIHDKVSEVEHEWIMTILPLICSHKRAT